MDNDLIDHDHAITLMSSGSQRSTEKESPQIASLQTRAILRILIILLAALGLLWVLLKLTTIILLVVLSIFFAYLVAPLVEIIERPIQIAGRRIVLPRAGAIGVAYLLILAGILVIIYFIVPQLVNQLPQFSEQAQ